METQIIKCNNCQAKKSINLTLKMFDINDYSIYEYIDISLKCHCQKLIKCLECGRYELLDMGEKRIHCYHCRKL